MRLPQSIQHQGSRRLTTLHCMPHPFFSFVILTVWLLIPKTGIAGNDPLPKGWQPAMDFVYEWLEDNLKDAPQQDMNSITARQAEVRDMELQLIYLKLWICLPEKDQSKLKGKQTKWLAMRRKTVATAADLDRSGSIAPMEANLAELKFTEKRIAELKKRLNAISGGTK